MGIKRGAARSAGAFRPARLTALWAEPGGRITREQSRGEPGVGSNLPAHRRLSPASWLGARTEGLSPAPAPPARAPGRTPRPPGLAPRGARFPELGGAGRSPCDQGGHTRTSPAARLVEAGLEALRAPCALLAPVRPAAKALLL